MPWVSQYLVMKRVSIEPNFHSLYSNFLDTLKNPEFNKMVLNETYRNIKVTFSSCTSFFCLSLEILDFGRQFGGGGFCFSLHVILGIYESCSRVCFK